MTVRLVPSLVELAGNALPEEIKEKYIYDTLSKKDRSTCRIGSIACKTIKNLDYTDNQFVTAGNAPQHVRNMPNLQTILYKGCRELKQFCYPYYAHLKHLELIDLRDSGVIVHQQGLIYDVLPLISGKTKSADGTLIPKKRVKVLLIDEFGRGVLGGVREQGLSIEVKKDAILSGSYCPRDIKDLVNSYFDGESDDIELLKLLLAQENFDCNMNIGSEKEPYTLLLLAIYRGSDDLLTMLLARKDLDVNMTFAGSPTTPYDEFALQARKQMKPEVAQYFENELLKRGAKRQKK